MATIETQETIDATVEEVWAVLTDIESVADWAPTVVTAVRTSERSRGLGVTRHCDLVPGFGTLNEKTTEWDEQQSIAWAMEGDGGPPITNAVGRYTLTPTANGTETSFTMVYDLADGVPDEAGVEIRDAFQNVVPGIVAGLKLFVETGQGTSFGEAAGTPDSE